MPEDDHKYWSFPHRLNRNGTFDSICPKCFVTIANAIHEVDLERFECHVCDPTLISLPKEDDIQDRFGNARVCANDCACLDRISLGAGISTRENTTKF
jgi:hypothetical protein